MVTLLSITSCKEELIYPEIDRPERTRKDPRALNSKQLQMLNHNLRSLDRRLEGGNAYFNQQMEDVDEQIHGTVDTLRAISTQIEELNDQIEAFSNELEAPIREETNQ